MSVHHMKVAAAVAALVAFSAAGFADDAADQANPDTKALLEYVKKLESRVNQLEAQKEWPLDQVRSESGSALENAVHSVNLSGYMEYQYGINIRHGGVNGHRGTDTLGFNVGHATSNDENGFSFQNLQLLADKPLTTANSTGFRVRAQYGLVSQFDNRDVNFNNQGQAFDVREAFMSWRSGADWGGMNSIDLSLGKFDSPFGAESPDNINNYQVTRGFAQAFLLPVTHTGLRAAMPWGDNLKSTFYVVNGWDNVRDTNDGKTFIASLEISKLEWMNSSLTFTGGYGDEGSISPVGFTKAATLVNPDTPDGNKTTILEATWRGEMDKDTHLVFDAIWCRQQNGSLDRAEFPGGTGGTGGEDSTGPVKASSPTGTRRVSRDVKSLAAYIQHQMSKDMWVSGRAGYYADDAFASGLGRDLRVYDVTVTVGWDLAADLTMAVEYRHDHSINSDFYFSKGGAPNDNQDTVTASFIYRF